MNTLSKDTLLKLEKRRNWFLERVLKLGSVSIAKEYQCCTTCPDPANCAKTLDEKWRAGYQALFRFGELVGHHLVGIGANALHRSCTTFYGISIPPTAGRGVTAISPYPSQLSNPCKDMGGAL